MSPSEETQEAGRLGTYRAKRWLECTTRVVAIPWVVYEAPAMLAFARPDGRYGHFDLAGYFLSGQFKHRPLYVESKAYSSPGHQGDMYVKYLADCYYATLAFGVDRQAEFMWLTWHPFGALSRWSELCSASSIRDALSIHESHLAGEEVDDELCEQVASRLWIVVLHERQEHHLVPSAEMVALVRQVEIARQLEPPCSQWP